MKSFKSVLFAAVCFAVLPRPIVVAQEATEATPRITVEEKAEAAVKSRTIRAAPGTPQIDGEIDEIWSTSRKAKTDRYVKSESDTPADKSAIAEFRCLWDEEHLYVLAEVTDEVLSASGDEGWQQDSVEIFIDQNMARATSYDDDDGQYRVNCEGNISYGQVPKEAMTAVAKKTKTGYVVEAAIELTAITAEKGSKIGFDVQVNDDSEGSGSRGAIMKWNDDSNESYHDASRLGTLVFGAAKKAKDKTESDK